MKILGVDPGIASTGFGVIELDGEVWRLVASGEAKTTASQPMPQRLATIHSLIARAIAKHKPDAFAIEDVFFAKNVRSAVQMAHGRGVAMLAAASADIPVFEYSALEIKQSVLGYGRATKTQVMQMVTIILNLEEPPSSDHQADAMACALAHAFRGPMEQRRQEARASDQFGDDPTKELLAMRVTRRRKRRR